MLTRFKKILALSILVSMTLTGAACQKETGKLGAPKQITLNWWTVFKEPQDLQPLIASYRAQFPNVTVNIKTFRVDEYEQKVIEALAEDKGPDIITFHNTSLPAWITKLTPMPTSTNLEVGVEKGALKKKVYTEIKAYPSFTQRYLQQTFLDQVLKDAQTDGKTFGLPLAMDTLALYYNKSLLAEAGIALPATNYTQLQEHVLKLTKKDRLGGILQSGVALGSGNNIDRFTDILSLLMMQNGTEMSNDSGFATFDRIPVALEGRESAPAADSLVFYTDYANPSRNVYSWNSQLPTALEAFMQGRLAYFFGYSYNLPLIRAQAPKLNFDIAPMLQIEGNTKINFANYWLEGVSTKSKNPDVAWNFIQHITKPENVSTYLKSAKQPTATRSLIDSQREDLDIGVFADQLLTAKSWYKGMHPERVNTVFSQMISEYFAGTKEIEKILQDARSKINQDIR